MLEKYLPWGRTKSLEQSFKHLDVYCDVAPFRETMVKLESSPYINASYIKSPFQEDQAYMIAAQGPQNFSLDHFWQLVREQKVKRIITLCHKIGNKEDSDAIQYFPNENSKY